MQNLAEEDKNAMATNTLDSLPVELQLCILQQMPTLKSIHTLILASSKYYQTYTKFRSQVLYDLLLRQHNGEVDITEAVVAMRSEGVIAEDIRNQDKIFDLLDCRRRGTKELRTKFRHDSFTVKEIVKMMKLHEAAEYCIKDYVATLPRPDWWEDKRKWEPPFDFSHTERARFFRAFYRLQTWCHIFGQPEYHCSSPSSAPPFSFRLDRQSENDWTDRTFTHEQAWRMIWGTMPPWEVEEVGCLVDYSMLKYIHIFKEITTALINGYHPRESAEEEEEDTEPSSPTSSSRATSLPVGTEPLGSVYRSYETHGDPWSLARAFRYSMIEIGPYFLYKILQKPYDERHVAVSSNLRSVSITKLWEVTSLDDDQKLPLVSPADKYEREDLATIISSWHVLDRPNKSWILHWGRELHPRMWLVREFSPYSSYPIINRSMWTWGYVFWDDKRLDEWEAGYSFFT